MRMALMTDPMSLLEIEAVGKTYGGVHALQGVSLGIAPGEVHALCGENGAGKSTLIKIVSGAVAPDCGTVRMGGASLRPGDVHASERAGIAVIYQESTAFPHLTAEQNIFAGREPRRAGGLLLDRVAMRERTRALLDRLGERFRPDCPLAALTVAQRQMAGMARALSCSCRLLVMDEPTASLSARETDSLFRIVRQLRADGVSILYVSHRIEELFLLADRISVLRDGRRVATEAARNLSRQQLIRFMVGRDVSETAGRTDAVHAPGPALLEVDHLSRAGMFRDVSFHVCAGEVVGLGGLVGAGRSELAQTIFGIGAADAGTMRVAGQPLPPGSVRAAMDAGVALVPEDRQHLGLVLPMPVSANLTLCILRTLTAGGMIAGRREGERVAQLMAELAVKAASPAAAVETLSGGNQQKVMLGKWLATRPRVMLLDEPTRGVDVGAKAEVHRLVRRLAEQGMATLLISSELPELLAVSDRILVMREGALSGEFARAQATQEAILEKALPPS